MNQTLIDHFVTFLDSWLTYRVAHAHEVVGLSVAIQKGTTPVFSKAYGMAHVETATPLSTNHYFNMASQTKMLTAVLCLQLIEQEKLQLDTPITQYLTWLASHHDQRVKAITLRQLLSHSSGLPREGQKADFWLNKQPYPSKNELQQAIWQTSLLFSPGESIKYSNMGLALVGMILEAVANQPFTEQVKQHIIKPLRLEATPDLKPTIQHLIPTGYGLPRYHKRPALKNRRTAKAMACGSGLYATPKAMCQFAAALFDNSSGLLGQASLKEMQRDQSTMRNGHDKDTSFGLGQEIQYISQERVVGHTGHAGGHVTATFFSPKSRIAISVAANAKDTSSALIARGIWGAFDFFLRHGGDNKKLNPDLRSFNVRLHNETSTVEIVQLGKKIIIIDPDSWEPFSWYEDLAILNDNALRFITAGSIYNEGELVEYTFDNNRFIKSVNLAGFTFFPS